MHGTVPCQQLAAWARVSAHQHSGKCPACLLCSSDRSSTILQKKPYPCTRTISASGGLFPAHSIMHLQLKPKKVRTLRKWRAKLPLEGNAIGKVALEFNCPGLHFQLCHPAAVWQEANSFTSPKAVFSSVKQRQPWPPHWATVRNKQSPGM